MATPSQTEGRFTAPGSAPDSAGRNEAALQHALTAWVISGLFFMLLPGTFLGVWNLISITNHETLLAVPPAWIQAHGHAQIFGWIGSFILGIGFYSLSKMARLGPVAAARAWWCWAIWTTGVGLRWYATVTDWHWRSLLPLSAAMELAAFLLFFVTISRHRREPQPHPAAARSPRPVWMRLVIASTLGFLATLLANFALSCAIAIRAGGPAFPHLADQRLLTLTLWAFIVPAIWGFNARWLPTFLGLSQPSARGLGAAYACALAGVLATLFNGWMLSGLLATAAALTAIFALRLLRPAVQPPKTSGVHPSFPAFLRVAYLWLLTGAALSIWAAASDRTGGIWGASRHALTVGFIATMVFAVGQRVLPAFCGMRALYSPRLMLWSLALLTLGCALRVTTEPLAYQGYAPALWPVLPVSALLEMAGVVLFALNIALTLLRPPEHLRLQTIRPAQPAGRGEKPDFRSRPETPAPRNARFRRGHDADGSGHRPAVPPACATPARARHPARAPDPDACPPPSPGRIRNPTAAPERIMPDCNMPDRNPGQRQATASPTSLRWRAQLIARPEAGGL